MVEVLGVPHIPRDGFTIGSPEAAGGSSVTVAVKEHRDLTALPRPVQHELTQKAWTRRWMDDWVMIWSNKLSAAAAGVAWQYY